VKKRPWAVTVLGLLFIVAGLVGLLYHLTQEKLGWELLLISLLRLLAVIGGSFLLLGRNWARWLTVIWLAVHVVISAFHSLEQMAAHAVLLVIVAYFLFNDRSAEYFRPAASSS
jgi:hypothetical protein